MLVCPRCGRENPDGARFCNACAAPIEIGAPREERKVVSVLFADLVGFTSRAERLDPEDVRAILAAYHERVRAELERHGGTVEKFIGDAVMALFGAPIAHEDDPERAVRAGLAVRETVRDLNEHKETAELHVRIGVTTGEALVSLDARPEAGEGMAAGDVVNTAARLQGAAPADGILVDETTHRATRRVVDYREHRPVQAKGKEAPVPAFEALRARSRLGVDVDRPRTRLIGRDRELAILVAALARVRDEREPQLVTLVGVPGIGKSRLVQELLDRVDAAPDLITWRQGRCLPYGDGVTFWALGEMVKAQAGILESDSAEDAAAKLRRTVHELIQVESDWVETHLRPLVGLASESEFRGAGDEAPAAWQRFFEAVAEQRPTALVFEDLHWADEGLLDFVDRLVEWAGGVPLLVVCTARPELLSRRPGWGGGKPNAVTVTLPPLSADETARLVAGVLGRSVLPAESQSALLERAGGNPLYAEEFARMVAVRGGENLALPETVQGIVAARLDTLPREEKELLQDGAVVGKVFWLGAVAAISGGSSPELEGRLHSLERGDFLRRERRPSVAGEREYAFRHGLVRDVAYGQIPRAGRVEKHRRAAEWIESLGRREDHAELLAHHYLAALELAAAAGQVTDELRERAGLALREAGDRALALKAFPAALRFYRQALELTPAAGADRARLLFASGKAQYLAEEQGVEVLAAAREALLELGDREATAEAEVMMGDLYLRAADRERGAEHLARAAALLADSQPSRSKAYVLATISRFKMLASETGEAVRFGQQALRMAEELGLADLRALVLNNVGCARVYNGDRRGLDDLEQSIALAEQIGDPWHTVRGYGNLAGMLAGLGELRRAAPLHDKGLEIARRLGIGFGLRFLPSEQAMAQYWAGRWDEAERIADEEIAAAEAGSPHFTETWCRSVRGSIRLARGDVAGALEDARRGLEVARRMQDPQVLWPALAFFSRAALAAGRSGESEAAADGLLEHLRSPLKLLPWWWPLDLVWSLRALGREQDFREASEREQAATLWLDAARAIAAGDVRGGADILGRMAAFADEAYARLRAAELLPPAEASVELERALGFFRSVGASAYAGEAEALLAATGSSAPTARG